jgi:cell wall-associated NlpC family hydrolase
MNKKGLTMNRSSRLWIGVSLLVAVALSGCASSSGPNMKEVRYVQKKLEMEYTNWKGTPYRLGGESKNGVDCSSLIQQVMNRQFKLNLPRTTRQQIRTGKQINPRFMLPGDIVFFRTGQNTLHAGIIIYKGKFMHASSSKGVIISRLGNSYWSERFIGARRVL